MNSQNAEAESLALLKETQAILTKALDGLNGKTTRGEASYLVWGCAHVSKIIGGYCALRNSGYIHASKILVRPVIETIFAVMAILKQPQLLFRKAYTEYKGERKLLDEGRRLAEQAAESPEEKQRLTAQYVCHLAAIEKNFKTFTDAFHNAHPNCSTEETPINLVDLAEAAELGPWYSQYRIYCQFTHGSLQAASGNLDDATDLNDNRAMIWLTLILLRQLQQHTPTDIPDINSYWKRAEAMLH